jgi:hypothetical protein
LIETVVEQREREYDDTAESGLVDQSKCAFTPDTMQKLLKFSTKTVPTRFPAIVAKLSDDPDSIHPLTPFTKILDDLTGMLEHTFLFKKPRGDDEPTKLNTSQLECTVVAREDAAVFTGEVVRVIQDIQKGVEACYLHLIFLNAESDALAQDPLNPRLVCSRCKRRLERRAMSSGLFSASRDRWS